MVRHTKAPFCRLDPGTHRKCVRTAVRLLIPENKWPEALRSLNSVIELTRLEQGCISCRLYRDIEEEGALMLEQIWSSQRDLERHLRTDRFHTVLLVVEMASEYPEIRFDVIAHTSGMETIRRIRT